MKSKKWIIIFVSILLILLLIVILLKIRKRGKPIPFELTRLVQGYPLNSTHPPQIIQHSTYHLSYNEEHEQADWVVYILTEEKVLHQLVKRKNNYRKDPIVLTGSATNKDYYKSGFDRGHLVPAEDMRWSKTAMSESFYLSNMSPQKHDFNAGIWKRLENQAREWAIKNDSIYIVTGPVLKYTRGTIGSNNVSVPGYFYKVILDVSAPDYKGIAFLMKNESSGNNIMRYAITIDSLEKFTDINFFYYLDTNIINPIEKQVDIDLWK